jgi:toxin HigB-1
MEGPSLPPVRPCMPIKSIRHKGLRLLHEEDDACGVPADVADRLRDMLAALTAAAAIEDMEVVPGWRLSRIGRKEIRDWALGVSRGCWLIFRFEAGDAFELDLVDDPERSASP